MYRTLELTPGVTTGQLLVNSDYALLIFSVNFWPQQFKSHCAPEPTAHAASSQLTSKELREKLAAAGQPTGGKRSVLLARLAGAESAEQVNEPKVCARPLLPEFG